MAKGVLDLETGHFKLTDISLVKTATSTNKRVRKNSDDLERAKKLYKGIHAFLLDVDMVCVEIPVGSQTARAMMSYGACIGLLASVNIPMVQVTPTEVKLAGAGTKTASKQAMIDWATQRYPNAEWLTKKQKGVVSFIGDNEHIADALAAIHAGVRTEQFNQAIAFYRRK